MKPIRTERLRGVEQFHQIERMLSEIALKAFDAGPHKTKDGHTEISYSGPWPPTKDDKK
jgi:hypothetical protein